MQSSTSWKIGSIAGAPIIVRPGAFLLIVVFSAMYFGTFSRYSHTAGPAIAASAALAVILVLSVFLHEVAHVLCAKVFGVAAQEIGLTFFGGHAGFKREFTKPWHSFVVSVAGPLTNIALGFTFMFVARGSGLETSSVLTYLLLDIAGTMNFFLGVFNLLPGLPLDGGNALSALIWQFTNKRSTGIKVAARIGQAVCVAWVVFAIGLPLVQGQGIDTIFIIWTLLIVGVLWSGAKNALQRAESTEKLAQIDVRSITTPVILARPEQNIGSLTSALITAPRNATIITLDGSGRAVGYVDPSALAAVPADSVEQVPVSAVSVPLVQGSVIAAGSTAEELLRSASHNGSVRNLFVLEDHGAVVGVVWVASLIRAININ